ncbi:hypothetical protein N7453_002473 [Penicillium expansum]|nr:hypothetical protein N7453_002473 [Penicillium expansum]
MHGSAPLLIDFDGKAGTGKSHVILLLPVTLFGKEVDAGVTNPMIRTVYTSWPGIFQKFGTEPCFSVQLFNQPILHRHLDRKIRDEASRKKHGNFKPNNQNTVVW